MSDKDIAEAARHYWRTKIAYEECFQAWDGLENRVLETLNPLLDERRKAKYALYDVLKADILENQVDATITNQT